MDAKRFASVVLGSLLALGQVRAQVMPQPMAPPGYAPAGPQGAPMTGPPPEGAPMTQPMVVEAAPIGPVGGYDVPGISNWIRRDTGPCCNGPFGRNSEIGQELYFRSGVSVPVGNQLLTRNSTTGFTVEGGARTLFFNHEFTRAWVVDTGMVNTYNSGVANPDKVIVNGLRPGVVGFQNFFISERNINRTMVSLGIGREWFAYPAKDSPSHWRFGVDGGARYGTMKLSLNELVHRTDVIGGAYLGTHANYEFLCGHYIIDIGGRTEYAYTWSDIFQKASDMSEVNFLATIGIRY